MPKIFLSRKAEKDFSRLQKKDKERIIKKLEAISLYPLTGKNLKGELKGNYSLKVWPFRIIYAFNTKSSKVIIKKIQQRQGAYKK